MRIILEIFIHFEGKAKFEILQQAVHIEAIVIKIIQIITTQQTSIRLRNALAILSFFSFDLHVLQTIAHT
jgi:hypothetical protein